jgi:kynureninase
MIAPLIGAAPDEVISADSTSVNLYKLIVAALRLDPKRNVVVSEAGNFPTDLHIAEGAVAAVAGAELRVMERGALAEALGDDTALLMLTHVHYKTAERFDMAAWTKAAHDAGALVCWDLSHSAGAVAVGLNPAGADLAVGCGYKYLNGGPGAPAFLYVAKRWQERLQNPLSGWMGHAAPFEFADGYEAAPGMKRWLTGTPCVLSLVGNFSRGWHGGGDGVRDTFGPTATRQPHLLPPPERIRNCASTYRARRHRRFPRSRHHALWPDAANAPPCRHLACGRDAARDSR